MNPVRVADDELVSTPVAAKAVGVSARTLERWVKQGHVRPAVVTFGGKYRWDVETLKRQLREWGDRQRERDE